MSVGGIRSGKLEMDFVSTDVGRRACDLPPMEPRIFELLMCEIRDLRGYVSQLGAPARHSSHLGVLAEQARGLIINKTRIVFIVFLVV